MFDQSHLFRHQAVSFVDTFRAFYRHPLPRRAFLLVERNCRQIDSYDHDGKGITYHLQQPNRRAIAILDRWFRRNRDFVNEVDLALDIAMHSFADALDASYYCRVHMRHRYSHESPNACLMTSYTQRRRWYSVNLVNYAADPSKVLNVPALHIEWRIKSAKNVRRIGVSRPGSLLRFRAEEFWRQRWLFETFSDDDMARAAQCSAARSKRCKLRMLSAIRSASVCDDEGTISAGAFRFFCTLLRLPPERYLHPLEIPFPHHFRWQFDDTAY